MTETTSASLSSDPAEGGATANRLLLRRIARQMAREDFGTGALASVRRGDPSRIRDAPSFHRLTRIVDERAMAGDGALRWATAVHLIATLTRPGGLPAMHDVGRALAEAGFSESRLARLLASRGEAFRDQATLAARFLHGRDAACMPLDLAELALVDERAESRAERLRFRIARSYYRVADVGAEK